MRFIGTLVSNPVLNVAFLGWFLAQFLKIPIHFLMEHEWDWKRFVGSGGMPSSHTAMTVSAMIMVGALEGFSSPLFAVCAVFTSIVMYDATGVRRETGKQATIINRLVNHVLVQGKPITDVELKELVGHKPTEVAGGVLLGVVISAVYILLMGN